MGSASGAVGHFFRKETSHVTLWNRCVDRLEGELPPQQFNTWIRPLQAVEEEGQIRLLAPNQFVLDWVKKNYLKQITVLCGGDCPRRRRHGS